MARKNYTEEQKAAVLARAKEIGISAAAREAGISVANVSKWNKAAKTAEAQELYDKAADEATEAVADAIAEADLKMAEAEDAAQAIVDQAKAESKAAVKEAIDDKKTAVKIETKKKTAARTRKRAEKQEKVKAAVEKPVKKIRAAKMELVFESQGGRQIKPEEIATLVPKGCDAAYIKLEENKIYWVKGSETGAVDIW